MLSNYLVGSHKVVLIQDDVGIERSSEKLIDKLLKEHNTSYEVFNGNHEFCGKTAVVLEAVSKLELDSDEKGIIENLQLLRHNKNVSQIFLWATSKNISSTVLVPFLQHMSNVIVHITSVKHLKVLTKRKYGSIQVKDFQHELCSLNTSIKEVKVTTKPKEAEENIEPVGGTFKIGKFNDDELEMKRKLKLPFELM